MVNNNNQIYTHGFWNYSIGTELNQRSRSPRYGGSTFLSIQNLTREADKDLQ